MEVGKAKEVASREDEGTVVHVRDEVNEPAFYEVPGEGPDAKPVKKPVTITVAGTYSKKFRKAKLKQRERVRKRGGRPDSNEEESERRENEVVADCVIGWEGFTSNGKPFEFSTANCMLLFESAPWILEQVQAAMSDHESFTGARSVS